MKGFMLGVGLTFLIATYLYLKTITKIKIPEAVGIVAIIGFNPNFLLFATRLASEIPYALISLLALWFYERFLVKGRIANLILTLAFATLAFFTRTFGIALLAAIVVHLFVSLRFRLVVACTIFSAVIALLWFAWSWTTIPAYSPLPLEIRLNYTGYTNYASNLLLSNWIVTLPLILLWNLSGLIQAWSSFIIPWNIGPLSVLVAAVGFYPLRRALSSQPRLQDFYLVFSLLISLLWTGPQQVRYLLVVSPFLVYYCFVGIKLYLNERLRKRWSEGIARKATRITLVIVVLLVLVGEALNCLALRNAREKAAPIVYLEFHRMLNWLEKNSGTDAIFVGAYDPAYYLFTGRKAVRLSFPNPLLINYTHNLTPELPNAALLLNWFDQVNACFIIDDPMIAGPERLFYKNLIEALKTNSQKPLSPIYFGGNGMFVVYKIGSCPVTTR